MDFNEYKKRYGYTNINDEDLQEIINTVKEYPENEQSRKMNSYITDYIKKHMDVEMVIRYIQKLRTPTEITRQVAINKLSSTFNWLERIQYEVTPEFIRDLYQESLIKQFLDMMISGKRKSIKEMELNKITKNNKAFKMLLEFYLNKQKIEIEYFEKVFTEVPLNCESNNELYIKAALKDKEAIAEIVKRNQGLVKSVASRYANRGLNFDDLMQEGNIGLLMAIEKFDFKKGFSFSTYASYWIRQEINRGIANQARMIRVPVHVYEDLNKFLWKQSQLEAFLGHQPTLQELVQHLGLTEEQIQEYLRLGAEPASLETNIGEDEDSELINFIADSNSVQAEEIIEKFSANEIIEIVKEILTEKEWKVLILRFGLVDGTSHTLEEVAQLFGLTRERIRQIETKALQKIKSSPKIKHYNDIDYKDIFQNKVGIQKQNELKKVYDLKEIHPDLTFDLFKQFAVFFKETDMKNFCMYHGISLKYNCLYLPKKQEYPESFKRYMQYIEEEFRTLYEHYLVLTNVRKMENDKIEDSLKKYMINHYLNFRFPEFTYKELTRKVADLPINQRKIMYLRFGKNLLEFHSFPKDGKNYYAMLGKAFKTIQTEKSLEYGNYLQKKYSNLTLEQLQNYVEQLPKTYRNILYQHYGTTLDSYYSFLENRTKNSNLTEIAIRKLDEIINGKQEKDVKHTSKEKSVLEEKLKEYTLEEIQNAVIILKKEYKYVLCLRHGNCLDEFKPFPNTKPYMFFKKIYEEAIEELKEVLYKEKFPKKYEAREQKRKEQMALREERKKAEAKKSSSRAKSHHNILFTEDKELVKWAVGELKEASQEILYLRNGKELNLVRDWPPAPKDKCKNYYYVRYNQIIKQVEILIANKKNGVVTQKKVKEPKTSILTKYTSEEIAYAYEYLSEKNKEIFKLRHGETLSELLPWPPIPEGKSTNYYYTMYYQISLKIEKILGHKEIGESVQAKPIVRKTKKNIINLLSHEELVTKVSNLTLEEQQLLKLRHGETLTETLPWPEIPAGKCKNHYYAKYRRIVQKLMEPVQVEVSQEIIAPVVEKSLTSKQILNTEIIVNPIYKKKKIDVEHVQYKVNKMNCKDLYDKLYKQFYALYYEIIEEEIMKKIILYAISSYDRSEGLSIDLSAYFKTETEIMYYLQNKYRESINEEEKLTILITLEAIYKGKLRQIDYSITDARISSIIESELINYTGKLPFSVQIMKRQLQK